MRKRITQREAIFYRLYQLLKEKRGDYIPVYELMGEIYCHESGKWGFVSYECSARASELIKENPSLFQRQMLEGKSGAKYYGYRMNPEPSLEMIESEDLRAFHRMLKRNQPSIA
jgi:hypothetical protein